MDTHADEIAKILELHEDDSDDEQFSSEVEDEVEEDDNSEDEEASAQFGPIPCTPGVTSPNEELIIIPKKSSWQGRNKHRWSTVQKKTAKSRRPSHNIIHIVQGPTREALSVDSPLRAFNLFITNEMVNEILTHTNSEVEVRR